MKLLRFIFYILILSVILESFVFQDFPLNKEDQETIAKAQELNQSAQEYLDKANEIYSEIAELNSSDDKKGEKLKGKALDNQIKALELQKEANMLEYDVYKKIISELKTGNINNKSLNLELNLLTEQADEFFYKAEKLRNEAYQLDKDQKDDAFLKLDEAQGFEKTGIIQQKKIIDIYLGKEDIKTQKSTKSDQDIVINEEMLDSYLEFMSSDDSISSFESFRNIMFSDSLSFQDLREERDRLTYALVEQISSEIVEEHIAEEYIAEQIEQAQTEYLDVTEKDYIAETKTEVVVFKIQITADKKGLSQSVLRKVYNGKKDISMIDENGWKKYLIGDFNTYSEADEFRKGLGVSDAFVAKYQDNRKVDVSAQKKVAEQDTEAYVEKILSGIIFKVQIAASINKLTEEILKKIYSGDERVNHKIEEGWNKYSIGKCKSYKEAKELIANAKVNDAFIVAYKDGVKISTYLAIKGITSVKKSSKDKIVFKVQIAADTKEISSDKIHKIYSGFENVDRFDEDSWHKYAIGEFDSFKEANELRKNSGVKGAFVIAFRGDAKMNVLDAKKLTRCIDSEIITNWDENKDTKIYRVQIAASRKEFTKVQMKNLYCRESKVYLIKEDNWFKYSIGNFLNYNEASKLRKKCGVNGAFVVIYKNGVKVN